MGTRICFAAGSEAPLTVSVTEQPDEVSKAWINSSGRPVVLTDAATKEKVWINPALVAFWEPE